MKKFGEGTNISLSLALSLCHFFLYEWKIILRNSFSAISCICRLTLSLCFIVQLVCATIITRQTIYNQRQMKWALLLCEKSANSCSLTISHNLHAILYEIQNTNNQTTKPTNNQNKKGKALYSLLLKQFKNKDCKAGKQMTL